MKILNVNSYYFSSSVYKPMEQALINHGCDFTTYVPLSKTYVVRDECKYEENPSYLDIIACYNKNDRILFHLKHNKIKRDFLSRYNFKDFDLLHAHSLFSNGYIAYTAYKKYNIPYIVAVRRTDIHTFFKMLIYLRKLGVNILLHASAIIFLSTPYKRHCIQTYIPKKYQEQIANKSFVIPNGVDQFWIENKYKEPHLIDEKNIKLIFAGAIDRNKNLETVVKTCEILINKGYKISFTVVGKILDSTIGEKLKKHDFIDLIGRVDKEELLEYYRQNNIFVMPSKTETFGLVYLEAMSQGLPVIYTRGEGFDGQFDEGVVGYSVNSMDENEIADKIIQIKANYHEISQRCLQLVDAFDWNSITQEYKKLYKTIKDV